MGRPAGGTDTVQSHPSPSSSPPTPARLGLDFPSTRSDEAAAALQSPRTASQARMGTEATTPWAQRGRHGHFPAPRNLREGLQSTSSWGTMAQESA